MSEKDVRVVAEALEKFTRVRLENLFEEFTESPELRKSITVHGLDLVDELGKRMAEEFVQEQEKWFGWLLRQESRTNWDEES